jgi:hypothetical protein
MQIEATYDQGRLIFDKPFRLQRNRFRVKVELPEDILKPPTSPANIQHDDPWLSRLEEIKKQVMFMPEEDLAELSKKDKKYMQAFSLREER